MHLSSFFFKFKHMTTLDLFIKKTSKKINLFDIPNNENKML